VLLIRTLYGGNDGINTVIPYADNAYHDARPGLAYAPSDVLALDGQLGLNPALKDLAQQWNARKLAIVRGVSQKQPVDLVSKCLKTLVSYSLVLRLFETLFLWQ
jgi:uncharacterized protein (DUF1501 family)